jgi:hypothetical protein
MFHSEVINKELMFRQQMEKMMQTTMTLAIETYANLSGMTFDEVAKAALTDGPVQNSVMMLMFVAA